jgi:hypothetical protein
MKTNLLALFALPLCGCAPKASFHPLADASSPQVIRVQADAEDRDFDTFYFRIRGKLEGKAEYSIVRAQSRTTAEVAGTFDRELHEMNWNSPVAEIHYTPAPGANGSVEYSYHFGKKNEN